MSIIVCEPLARDVGLGQRACSAIRLQDVSAGSPAVRRSTSRVSSASSRSGLDDGCRSRPRTRPSARRTPRASIVSRSARSIVTTRLASRGSRSQKRTTSPSSMSTTSTWSTRSGAGQDDGRAAAARARSGGRRGAFTPPHPARRPRPRRSPSQHAPATSRTPALLAPRRSPRRSASRTPRSSRRLEHRGGMHLARRRRRSRTLSGSASARPPAKAWRKAASANATVRPICLGVGGDAHRERGCRTGTDRASAAAAAPARPPCARSAPARCRAPRRSGTPRSSSAPGSAAGEHRGSTPDAPGGPGSARSAARYASG